VEFARSPAAKPCEKLAQPVGEGILSSRTAIVREHMANKLLSGNTLVRRNRGPLVSALVFACSIGASTIALAEGTKPVLDKWRPKDGLYIIDDADFTGPCQDMAQYLFELGKRSVIGNESFDCKITRLRDTAPGALRLDLTCDGDENDEKKHQEVMTLRKNDENSFFMRMTKKGKFRSPEWRVNYCPKTEEDGDPGSKRTN
jgi:hypothetical protein